MLEASTIKSCNKIEQCCTKIDTGGINEVIYGADYQTPNYRHLIGTGKHPNNQNYV